MLILTLVVGGVTAAGGWSYYHTARAWLTNSDRLQAVRMAEALSLAAQADMGQLQSPPLQRLAGDFIRNESVRYVALLDVEGMTMASASRGADPSICTTLRHTPVAVWDVRQVSRDVLTVACPILLPGIGREGGGELVGATRLVLDTGGTARHLTHVQKNISVIAATIILCAIPLGYLLVWRLIVRPIRCLVTAARRLAQNDFAVRVGLDRSDEIGELSSAFDVMAGEIARSHQELVLANERLERKVAERTAELQSANSRLREEAAEREDFLRAVSHDLSAPLRNIAGMATMTLMKWRDKLPEEILARLQRIQANVDVETTLINDLLELSRIRTRPQKREVVDVGALIGQLAQTFEFELRSRGIKLEVQAEMPRLYVEKMRLRQVFQNLIDNAIKYMHRPAGGRIEVGYQFVDGMHQFRVQDNGPGIPPEDQQMIFYIFRRSGNAAGVEGKGIGLALVKSVASTYDGRCWVQSQVGCGATFYVAFSAWRTQPPGDQTPEGAGRAMVRESQAHCDIISGR